MSWDALGDLLYRTLFDEAEELRAMFFNLTQVRRRRRRRRGRPPPCSAAVVRADGSRTHSGPRRARPAAPRGRLPPSDGFRQARRRGVQRVAPTLPTK